MLTLGAGRQNQPFPGRSSETQPPCTRWEGRRRDSDCGAEPGELTNHLQSMEPIHLLAPLNANALPRELLISIREKLVVLLEAIFELETQISYGGQEAIVSWCARLS